MKKFLLSLAAVVLVGAFAMAEPVTVNFADETTAALLPKTESATPSTVKINGIDFEFMNSKKGAYSGASFLQISAKKVTPYGYVAFTLPDNCTKITITTGANASVAVKVSLLAGTNTINKDVQLNAKGADFAFEIPTDYQAAGTKYTLQVTNKYNAQISKVVFEMGQGGSSTLIDAGLAFDSETINATLGEAVPANALNKKTDAAVVYTSSNVEVATVDAATGEVTLVAAGTTTIKATTEATDKYKAGEASYTLTVTDKADIVYENTCFAEDCGFTFEAATDFNPWVVDSEYGLKASAYKSGAANASDAYAVSPVFDLTNRIAPAEIAFEQAMNQFKLNNKLIDVADVVNYVEIAVREEGATTWTKLSDVTAPAKFAWTYYDQTIDLSTYVGKKVQVGFHYISTAEIAGTWELKNVKVTAKLKSAVSDITVEDSDAPVVYYNLQGVRVANPANGLYIRVQGKKATKVLVR